MANLFIKVSKEEVVILKRIVRALGFKTMTAWLKAWILEHSVIQEEPRSREDDIDRAIAEVKEENKLLTNKDKSV
jgi:hypothetical protein